MDENDHQPLARLEEGLAHVAAAPSDEGTVELIVCRPAAGERVVLAEAELDTERGLVGDDWLSRGSRHTPDGSADPETQVTLMSARVIGLVSPRRERWALAGDQLFVDLDLTARNLPPGTRLAVGTALLEVSTTPHTGCAKFVARFGEDAMRFVNSRDGRARRLRGVNARVVRAGVVRTGDRIRRA